MRKAIAWTVLSALLLPLFVGATWAILPSVDPVAKVQRIAMMANQVRQITAAATQISTLGVFERLSHPSSSIRPPHPGPSLQETMEHAERPTGPGTVSQPLGNQDDGAALSTSAGVKSDPLT